MHKVAVYVKARDLRKGFRLGGRRQIAELGSSFPLLRLRTAHTHLTCRKRAGADRTYTLHDDSPVTLPKAVSNPMLSSHSTARPLPDLGTSMFLVLLLHNCIPSWELISQRCCASSSSSTQVLIYALPTASELHAAEHMTLSTLGLRWIRDGSTQRRGKLPVHEWSGCGDLKHTR